MHMFMNLYEHYKTTWSLEMRLTKGNMTYKELEIKSMEDEEWF